MEEREKDPCRSPQNDQASQQPRQKTDRATVWRIPPDSGKYDDPSQQNPQRNPQQNLSLISAGSGQFPAGAFLSFHLSFSPFPIWTFHVNLSPDFPSPLFVR